MYAKVKLAYKERFYLFYLLKKNKQTKIKIEKEKKFTRKNKNDVRN